MTAAELSAARKQLGLSPVEMARALGVTYQTWHEWESGRRRMTGASPRAVELLLMYPRTAQRLGQRD